MKTDTVFKRAFNDALDVVSRLKEGEQLPSENTLSLQLGVSRTTVRKHARVGREVVRILLAER